MRPQETMDWDDVITCLNDRILALENHNRAHGQRTAEIISNFNIIGAKLATLLMPIAEDVPLYKMYFEIRFNHVTSACVDKFRAHDANFGQIKNSIDVAGNNRQPHQNY